MCRISGIVSLSGIEHDSVSGISRMLSSMKHGGPDDEGIFFENGVMFGHRRLSIIDLSKAGHQPMMTHDSQIIISFNGEIYNYQPLKKELEEFGISFRTKTDTEVILYAYQQWGTEAFDRFQGIFAFSLYDKRNKKIFLVRDHIGVKPLYYFLDRSKLIFASEVRAFRALRSDWSENENWKMLFLAFGSLPHPITTLSDVYQLAPGSFLELNLEDFSYRAEQYYNPVVRREPTVMDQKEALLLMRESVRKALEKNLISDAPLGVFLSGGIDSSLLTLLADQAQENVKTISVNFDDASFDERPYQEIVLQKTKHVKHISYKLTEQILWEHMGDIWNAMDQPSIDGVNSYFVSACAKKEGLKAVLSGLGADEYFGGYGSIDRIHWIKRIRKIPFRKFLARLMGLRIDSFRRIMFLNIPGAVGDYLFLRGIHTPDAIAKLLGVEEEKVWKILNDVKLETGQINDDREYASFLEARIYMTNQLLKDTDYMSMWHGLEVRVPLLDIELLRDVQRIKPSLRYKQNWPKYLITASYLDVLPVEIIFRKKSGFTFPFALWMQNKPKEFGAMLASGNEVDKIITRFKKGRSHWSKYWSLAVVEQFRHGEKI